MPQGTIVKLVAGKHYGFIKGEEGELFFHASSLKGTTYEALSEGQGVEYEEGSGPKGPRTESVRPL
jgi:CspA family cold shock protein